MDVPQKSIREATEGGKHRCFYDSVTMHCSVWLALLLHQSRAQLNVINSTDRVSAACCALVAAGPRIRTMECSCWRTQYRPATVLSSLWLIMVHNLDMYLCGLRYDTCKTTSSTIREARRYCYTAFRQSQSSRSSQGGYLARERCCRVTHDQTVRRASTQ